MGKSRQEPRSKATVENALPQPGFRPGGIVRHAWLFIAVALITSLVGIVGALAITPVYEANTLIQINRSAPFTGDASSDVPAATEVEILRSRSIMSRVVNTLQLDISVEPDLFPLIGAYVARTSKTIPDYLPFGGGGYVWGPERVKVSVFNVPGQLLRQPFTLTAGAGGRFTLVQKELAIRLQGKVGERVKAATRFGEIELLVGEMQARTGSRFGVTRNPGFQVVEQLRKSLSITENGKESNVIGVSLKGSRPELISRILNEIGREYVSQHRAHKSNENTRALAFYDEQLAESRQRLQQLDERLSQVLRSHGVADLNEEGSTLSQQSIALQAKLAEAQQQKVELSSRFLEQHPAIIVADRHLQDVSRDLNRIESRRKSLAAAQQEIARLTRDRQANTEVNMGLMNSRQKLAALMSSENLDVRVVDRAEAPIQPVTLGLSVMIALACFAGLVAGVLAMVLRNAITGRHSQMTLLYVRDVSDRQDATVGG